MNNWSGWSSSRTKVRESCDGMGWETKKKRKTSGTETGMGSQINHGIHSQFVIPFQFDFCHDLIRLTSTRFRVTRCHHTKEEQGPYSTSEYLLAVSNSPS